MLGADFLNFLIIFLAIIILEKLEMLEKRLKSFFIVVAYFRKIIK